MKITSPYVFAGVLCITVAGSGCRPETRDTMSTAPHTMMAARVATRPGYTSPPETMRASTPVPTPTPTPTPTPEPVVIPTVAHVRMAPIQIDAGKSIPVICPRDIVKSKLRSGDKITFVVDDDGIPFSSGADASLVPGTRLEGVVERIVGGEPQIVFNTVIDGAGNRYPLIGGLTTMKGGELPRWMVEADAGRRELAERRLAELRGKTDAQRDTDRDALEQARSRASERAGDLKSAAVVLPWAMGSRGALIGLASYFTTKVTNEARERNEAEWQRIRSERESEWTEMEKQAQDDVLRELSEARLADAVKAARSSLRGDIPRGTRAAVTLTFVFSSEKTIDEMDEELHP